MSSLPANLYPILNQEVPEIVPVRHIQSRSSAPAPLTQATPATDAPSGPQLDVQALTDVVIKALEDLKAKDITVLDVRGRTSVTDVMIIASGTSSRHVKSLADNVVDEVKAAGERPLGVEGGATSDWILVDLGDLVVHVMLPATREFYDLERFWRDAPAPGDFKDKR